MKIMKKSILAAFICIFGIATANAQDLIVQKDGSIIKSKVYEVTQTEIKYKKFSNLDGPLYTIGKSDILSINYENGETDTFTNTDDTDVSTSAKSDPGTTSTRLVEVPAADDNQELLDKYNRLVTFNNVSNSKSSAKGYLAKFGVTKGSVLSNEDITISIGFDHGTDKGNFASTDSWGYYYLSIYNKTNQTLYIDLGNTFRIHNDGTFDEFYDNSQKTYTSGGSTGGGIALGSVANVIGIGGVAGKLLGGVTVGGSSSSGVSTTYTQERILRIPPKSTGYLTKSESLTTHINKKDNTIRKKSTVTYTEDETLYRRQFIITYSKDESFATYSTMNFGLFIQQVYGEFIKSTRLQFYWEVYLRVLKKTIQNYGDGDYIITGRGDIY